MGNSFVIQQRAKNRITIIWIVWSNNFTPRVCMYQRKMKAYIHTETCTWISIAGLLTIAKTWEPLKCLPRDFLGGSDGKSVCLQCRRPGFDSWVGNIPWRRKWQPISVVLPGKFHGQRSLVGYSLWGHEESDTTERHHLTFCHKGGIICISEIIDISPTNLDSSLCFFQSSIPYDVLCI